MLSSERIDIWIPLSICLLVLILTISFKTITPTISLLIMLFFLAGYITPMIKMSVVNDVLYNEGDMITAEFTVISQEKNRTVIKNSDRKYLLYTEDIYLPGDIIFLKGVYYDFEINQNPGAFRIDKYYKRRGISGRVFAEITQTSGRSSDLFLRILRCSYLIRKRMLEHLATSISGEKLALIQGMVTGYKEALSPETGEAFRDAGLSHILVVSGAHIALLILPLRFIVCRLFKKNTPRNIILITASVCYLLITGTGTSATRAVIMFSAALISDSVNARTGSTGAMLLTGMIMLLTGPFCIYDASFLLSFSACAGIAFLRESIVKSRMIRWIPGFVRSYISVSIAAQLAVIPVCVMFFNSVSLLSVFTNSLLMPIVQFLSLASTASFIPYAGKLLFPLIDSIAGIFLKCVFFTASFSLSAVSFPLLPLSFIIGYYFLLIELLIKKKRDLILINFLIFTLCASLLLRNVYKGNEIRFFSAGNGDSFLITTKENICILVDGGDPKNRFAEYTLVPFLESSGITYIDVILVTHSHMDHMEGLISVIDKIRAGVLVIPDTADITEYAALVSEAENRNIPVISVARNDRIKLGRLTELVIYNPEAGKGYENKNNESIVFSLEIEKFSFIFTGDAEIETEREIAHLLPDATILKVAHHGSQTSSGEFFLTAVNPEISIISAGNNNYGHPSETIIKRLERYGKVYVTKSDGQLLFRIRNDIIYLKNTYR